MDREDREDFVQALSYRLVQTEVTFLREAIQAGGSFGWSPQEIRGILSSLASGEGSDEIGDAADRLAKKILKVCEELLRP